MANAWVQRLLDVASKNQWNPDHFDYAMDAHSFNSLNSAEQDLLKKLLAISYRGEETVNRNLDHLMSHTPDAEIRSTYEMQKSEETRHVRFFRMAINTLGIKEEEILDMAEETPAFRDLYKYQERLTEQVFNHGDKADVLSNVQGYYGVLEGCVFFGSFAGYLAFSQRNLVPGLLEGINWVMRDESRHITMGANILKDEQLAIEDPMQRASELSKMRTFLEDAMPYVNAVSEELFSDPVLGITKRKYHQYVHWLANRRLAAYGDNNPIYSDAKSNPLRWLWAFDAQQHINFYEVVTPY